MMRGVNCGCEVEERNGGGGRTGKICSQDLDYRWTNGELTYCLVYGLRACVRYR